MTRILLKGVTLASGGETDVYVEDGTIRSVGPPPLLAEEQHDPALEIINGTGGLVLPSYVNLHTHLDKAFTLEEAGETPGDLTAAVAAARERKRRHTVEDVATRALRLISSSAASGTRRIRSHVDVDETVGLTGLDGVLEAKARSSGLCEVQIVAFPQEGLVGSRANRALLYKAVERGADLVGGMPHAEATTEDQRSHVDFCFSLASETERDLDLHVDESDDPSIRTLEMVADATVARGWHGRVTVAHLCSLSAADEPYVARVIAKCVDAAINVVICPTTNLVLQGRTDSGLVRRGLTRVRELREASVPLCVGGDNVSDLFYPFGRGDMLETALLAAHAAHLTGADDLGFLLDAVTTTPARVWGAEPYGLVPGAPSDLVLYAAASWREALRRQESPTRVFVAGREIEAGRSLSP